MSAHTEADLLVIGGGIHGAGIARDAAGRGLRVVLAEAGDLAGATSSASSKLIHGGLRYLEQLEFRLVAEALAEREVLLRAAPHLVHATRFVMPHAPGVRPAWVVRSGLFLYDWLARRDALPASIAVNFAGSPYGHGLKPRFRRGYAYSDCRVDDARLVVSNAVAAAELGATILPRTACVVAERKGLTWHARLEGVEGELTVAARAIVNASGPWVAEVLGRIGVRAGPKLKLIQGSHVVVPQLYDGDHAFILQNDDRRVIFVYPYQNAYTLIGTTDVPVAAGAASCRASDDEIAYLCRAANRYFARQTGPGDVVWSFCGVRALVDDGSDEPSRVTRDYALHVDGDRARAPVLSVLGGKITTYRRLSERALETLAPWLSPLPPPWTANALLPGGDLGGTDIAAHTLKLQGEFPELPTPLLRALALRHGSRAAHVIGAARTVSELGQHFGADLYACEVDYLMTHEWAREGEDVLWRRTKAGLHLSREQQEKVTAYMREGPASAMR